MDNIERLSSAARLAIEAAQDSATLEQLRVDYLGKKGQVTGLLKGLGSLPEAERPGAGAQINVLKQELQDLIATRASALEALAVNTHHPSGARPEHWRTAPCDAHHRAHGGFFWCYRL